MIYTSQSEDDTIRIAREISKKIAPGDNFQVLGEMGAGKSFLIRHLLFSLGVTHLVPSPTFTLINTYDIELQDRSLPVYHADMYRMESEDDLYLIGMHEYLDGDGIVFAEWADKFPDFFQGARTISVEIKSDTERSINLT